MDSTKKKKMTREERLEKKRLAKRARYQRIKNDPVKRAKQQETEKTKYKTKKEKGIVKLIKDMTPREQRRVRKKWRQRSSAYRQRRTVLTKITQRFMQNTTPSDSEAEEVENNEPAQLPPAAGMNARVIAARKKSEKLRKLRNRQIKKKDEEIIQLKKKLDRYRKRLTRANKNKTLTPSSKVQKMLESPSSRATVKKTLLFGEVMKEQIAENFKNLKSRKEKTVFSRLLVGKNVQKYKVLEEVGLSRKRLNTASKSRNIFDIRRKVRKDQIPEKIKAAVIKFLEDDLNTRICAGKKEFLTKNKERHQKRFLQDSMKNLHGKFLKNTGISITYSSFCKCRPFWVLAARVADRNTCQCIVHSNFDYMLEALNRVSVIPYSCHQKLLEYVCCDRYNEECLMRKCKQCKSISISYNEFNNAKHAKMQQWVLASEEIIDSKTNKARKVRKYAKKTLTLAPRDIITKLEEKLDEFFQHEMNIVHQYQSIKALKNNLTENECIIHMDFSENYSTKCEQEIQAFHFGGSRTQISLHTVVTYMKDNKSTTNEILTTCYCTMSSNLSHSPAAIWAHIMPILRALPPNITNLHFLSDGPVTQYRNKTMFYILACELKYFYPNLEKFTWNYHEAGHGKGAPGGVGAVCKRTADQVVARGSDVTSLQILADVVEKNCPGIKVMVIENYLIEEMEQLVKNNASKVLPFKGTLKVHQVEGNIFLKNMLVMRKLSCFFGEVCEHFLLGKQSYNENESAALQVEEVYAESEDDRELTEVENHQTDVSENEKGNKDFESEEPVASCSKPASICKTGDYVLVTLISRKTEYRYVAVCDEEIDEEEEIKVTFLKMCDKQGTLFKVTPKDVSFVSLKQIVSVLPAPSVVLKGRRVYYKFETSVEVFEK